MTTTTYQRTDTGEYLDVRIVNAEVDRLDSIADTAPVQWTPPDPYSRERCDCGEYHESALIAPSRDVLEAEGSTIAAEMVSGIDRTPGWPTWLDQVHHADATWHESITALRTWADTYTAREVERTVVEPVTTDWWERENRLMVGLMVREDTSVYAELAPERINEWESAKAITPDDEMKGSVNSGPPPGDRSDVERLAKRVPTALTTGETPTQVGASTTEPKSEPQKLERRGGLRRMWDAIRNWDGSGA